MDASVGGVGRLDFVGVNAFRITTPVTPENLEAAEAFFAQLLRRTWGQLGGSLQAGPEEVTVGGKLGFRFRGTATAQGTAVEKTDVFVFDGTTEDQLECQHTPGRAAEVTRACDQVVHSFTVT